MYILTLSETVLSTPYNMEHIQGLPLTPYYQMWGWGWLMTLQLRRSYLGLKHLFLCKSVEATYCVRILFC